MNPTENEREAALRRIAEAANLDIFDYSKTIAAISREPELRRRAGVYVPAAPDGGVWASVRGAVADPSFWALVALDAVALGLFFGGICFALGVFGGGQ